MKLKAVIRRLAVTLPFFAVAAVVLGWFSNPQAPASPDRNSVILIVTTPALLPAFEALESWNLEHGCACRIHTVSGVPGPATDADFLAALGAMNRDHPVSGILLGGDRRHLPILAPSIAGASRAVSGARAMPRLEVIPVPAPPPGAIPIGLRLGRAPVESLEEAWAFVENCRVRGKTLDLLIEMPVGTDQASLIRPRSLPELPVSLAFAPAP